jgi:flagellar biosynthesis protein FlhB
MAEQSGGEKTLPASQQKRQKAREEGRVAKSQDLTSAVAMLVALAALRYFGMPMFRQMVVILGHFFEEAHALKPTVENFQNLTIEATWLMIPVIGPFLLVMLVAGVVANVLQVGFMFTGKPLMPKLEKLNVFAGVAAMFKLRSLVELVKSVLKVTVATYIVWITMRGRTDELIALMGVSTTGVVALVAGMILTIWWRIVLAMLVLGALDYAFQWWQQEHDLMMSFQEAKEEMREFEGDPRIRQRVRQIQRQMAMQRMMRDVPTADVIITNPTTFAVALRYDPDSMAAPMVVAKGARLLAERIRDLAVEHDVPIVEKPELARALYRTIDIGRPVPEDLFRAVAEVLAYVFRIDRRAAKVQQRETQWAAAQR